MNTQCCDKCRSGYTQSPLPDLCATCACHKVFCCINCLADEKQVGTDKPNCAQNGRCKCHHTTPPSTEDWESELSDKYGSFEFSPTVNNQGYVNLRNYIAKRIEIARQEGEKIGRAKGLLRALSVLHEFTMLTTDTKFLDLIEAAQKKILAPTNSKE